MVNPQHANYAFTRQFIDTYLMTDGTPFTSKYPDYDDLDLVAECTDRDYRLAQTIRTPGFTRDGGTTQWAPDVKFSKTGYQPIKWLTDDSSKDTNVAAIASDVPLIRYAEVLLAYAEAKAELGEMSEEVWDKTIKPLRERAGVKSIYPTAADPYMVEYFQNQVTDPFILEVRRERGIELTMENSAATRTLSAGIRASCSRGRGKASGSRPSIRRSISTPTARPKRSSRPIPSCSRRSIS